MIAALTLNDANAQSDKERCVVLGKVVDQKTNAPLPFASVVLQGEALGTSTDVEGEFRLEGVPPGVHNVLISFLGYNNFVAFEIETTPSRPAVVHAAMSQAAVSMEAAEVAVESRATLAEAPLSVRSIGTNEIKRNPGGGATSVGHFVPFPEWLPSQVFETTLSSAEVRPMKTGSTSTALKSPTSITLPHRVPVEGQWA